MMAMTDMPADRQALDKDAQLQNPLYLMSGYSHSFVTVFRFKTGVVNKFYTLLLTPIVK